MSAEAANADGDRLAKLWEAYRVQEEELQDARARVDRLHAELSGSGEETQARERVVAEKDAEIKRLRETVEDRDARIRSLLQVEEDAKAVQAYKDRIAELESAYAQEKERLAKLFLLYEQATKDA